MTTQVYAADAENAEIWDVGGRRCIDFAAGIAVVNTGHPNVIAAVKDRLDRFTHTCHQIVPYENNVGRVERLNSSVPGDFKKKSIVVTMGPRRREHGQDRVRPRTAVIAFTVAFDGRTFMA
ncbi:aminotransferase class III-fold pyridoxal phosphate-dependent enzyme [Mesorhizobium temperatum]|uniref:aminotransferase class III-fold pyridoxal phosphate-dependent enzyme n=1 Tax=Mesorhizobium temperatum TaxID=241416 RepID=UPI003CCA12FC